MATYTASNDDGTTTGWIVTVSPGGGDGDFFSIDDDGVLTFDEPPDYEAPRGNTYSFSITAYDGNPPNGQRPGQTSFSVRVIVEDVEEISGPSAVDYPENGAGPVATYTVTDPAGPSIAWSLLDGDDSGLFRISSGGVLTFRASPNHEAPADADGNNVYRTTVKAVHGSKTNTLVVAVTVTNVNEAPEFPSTENGRRMVAEDAEVGEDIGDAVEATDPDVGDSLTYSLGGDDATSFDIVASTGQLQTEAPLDSDTKSRHTVTVTATDRAGLTDEITVTITVADVNEAPEFDDGPATTRTVPENTRQSQNIGDPVAATDPDSRDRLTYTLGGEDAASFDIVASSGQLRTRAALDFEATTTYSVIVYVRDSKDKFGAGDTATDDEITVTINVDDVEEVPEFPFSRTERMVAENTGPDQDIGAPVAATDGDNDTLTYTLGGTDAASFNFDTTTGQLQTKDPLDKETKSRYSVTVSVSDGKDVDGNPDDVVDATITVTITVTDVNETPEFPSAEDGTRMVAENTRRGQNIGAPVAATDGDRDTLTYTLGGDDAAAFDIDESSGQLRTKAPLDYEAETSYFVTVSVSDLKDIHGNPDEVVDATVDVTITVDDVNEAPEFTAGSATARTVAENTAAGEDIGTPVAATDDDNNEVLTYTLGGDDAAAFDIDESSGQLLTKDPLDHETKSRYTVAVSVRDSRDAAGDADTATDDTITVTINVADVNEAPVIKGEASVDYPENGDGPVATFTATDPEMGTLSWSLLMTGDYDDFTMDGSALSFNTPPDFEDPNQGNTYQVTVRVSDGTHEDTLAVNVTVTNEDEAGTLTRSSEPPQVEATLTATLSDPDGNVSSDIWEWERSATGSDPWTTISGFTPNTYTPVEADEGSYLRVTVTYTDGHGSAKTAQAVWPDPVRAAPEMNEPPTFADAATTREVAENTAAGEDIGDPVVATDPNTFDTTLTYSLSGTDEESFAIVPETGQLQTKAALNFETGDTYMVTVTAKDSSTETATIEVTINVLNVNDAPEFPSTLDGARTIPENTAMGVNIGAPVVATDQDDGHADTLIYTLGGTDGGSFDIDASSSQLLTDAALDYETKKTYTVTVIATDASSSSATKKVVIHVTDENDAPKFSGDFTRRTVKEDAAPGVNIGAPVAATDQDGDTLTYTLGGTDAASFTIVGETGQLKTKDPLDYASQSDSTYSVTVTATDPAGETDTIPVTIMAPPPPPTPTPSGGGGGGGSSSNRAPVFPQGSSTARSVLEQAAAVTTVGTPVTATDTDQDALTYSLGGTDAATFSIDTSSGQLRTRATLDYETKTSYSVTVSVSDGKDANNGASTAVDNTINVTIYVTDVTAPGQPARPTVEAASATSLTVTWTAPASTGAPISGYNVEYRATVGDEPFTRRTTSGSVLSLSISGLEPDTAYQVQVQARNAEGDSAWSPLGNGRTGSQIEGRGDSSTPGINLAPTFTAGSAATRTVAENTAAGQDIGTPVAATDTDKDRLVYSLGGTDAASFAIVASSGQLRTRAPLNYETKSSYSVTVSVSDSKNANNGASTATDGAITVTIVVTNVEEAGTVDLPSSQPQVGNQLTATLDDPDGNVTGVAWRWERSADNTAWTIIGGATAASYTPVVGDVSNYLRVTASYTDGEGSGKTAQAASAQAVRAAPGSNTQRGTNRAPVFTEGNRATRSTPEQVEAGTNLGDPVAAGDIDQDGLIYFLDGTDAASFSVVTTTGQLRTKAPLDYETKFSYTLTVTATDPSTDSDTIRVTITVTNAEEAGTVTLSSVQPQVDTPVTAALADPDGDVSGVTWRWERSADNTAWTVIGGATAASYTPVVGDVSNFLRVTASYTDEEGSGKTAQAASNNAVRAVPATNSAPAFPASETGARSVAEDAEASEAIGAPVAATDGDNDPLTYSLGGDDAASFAIVASSGQLQTKDPLDYETKSSYSVTVTATDPSSASDTTTVTVTVTNVEEAVAGGVIGGGRERGGGGGGGLGWLGIGIAATIMALGASLVGGGAIMRRRLGLALPGWRPLIPLKRRSASRWRDV